MYCRNCGKELLEGADFCLNCGVAVISGRADYLAGQDKLLIILICIFLGGFGVHNFIMGESKKGIFRLIMNFCFGIGYIFAIIDLVKIATDSYVVDPQKII